MFSRKIRRFVILLCAVMLMSSQYAVASYVCPNMSLTEMSAMNMDMADCTHEMVATTTPLCKAHCEQSPQSSEVPSITFAPFMVQTEWSLVYLDAFKLASSLTYNSPVWQTDGSPPLRIQFQVFRI